MQTDSKNASTNAKPNTESASVLALIPAYNETPHIASVVTGALAHLPVLVVDDGSALDRRHGRSCESIWRSRIASDA